MKFKTFCTLYLSPWNKYIRNALNKIQDHTTVSELSMKSIYAVHTRYAGCVASATRAMLNRMQKMDIPTTTFFREEERINMEREIPGSDLNNDICPLGKPFQQVKTSFWSSPSTDESNLHHYGSSKASKYLRYLIPIVTDLWCQVENKVKVKKLVTK